MSTDLQLKQLLEDIVSRACDAVSAANESYKVRFMGRIKKESNINHGWYVPVQNFDDLVAAKKSGSNDYFRHYFRIIQTQESDTPRLQISKWTPSMGSVEDYETEFDEPYPIGLGKFRELLEAAIEKSGIDPV